MGETRLYGHLGSAKTPSRNQCVCVGGGGVQYMRMYVQCTTDEAAPLWLRWLQMKFILSTETDPSDICIDRLITYQELARALT